tara:strand:- start:2234 stop:2521 length:288 start_codon:yes stop_codon:yes gene_type:complete
MAGNKVIAANQVSIVTPFGFTGSLAAKTFLEKFRTFSILNNSGGCTVTMPNGNVMNIPVGVTVNWDAGTQYRKLNKLKSATITVTADDCVIVATI